MPTLPLDHPDPLAATLATMHYPNADDRKQRQVLIDCLMPLVQSYRQSSQSFGCDQLVGQAVGMAGTELPDLEERIFAATAVGQVNKAYFVLAWNDTKTASWANARKTANTVAGPIAKRRISDSYFKWSAPRESPALSNTVRVDDALHCARTVRRVYENQPGGQAVRTGAWRQG